MQKYKSVFVFCKIVQSHTYIATRHHWAERVNKWVVSQQYISTKGNQTFPL